MKRYIRSSSGYPYPYVESPEYKKLAEYDYILELKQNGCVIKFSDGDVYAKFKFVPPDEDFIEMGDNEWFVYADGDMINEYIDYPPENYDECVTCAIRYFWSHY